MRGKGEEIIMEKEQERASSLSRRNFMTKAGIFVAGGIAGCTSLASTPTPKVTEPPPLPWKWVRLDPLEAGRRAYRGYLSKPGG
jgi:hypothetical protein